MQKSKTFLFCCAALCAAACSALVRADIANSDTGSALASPSPSQLSLTAPPSSVSASQAALQSIDQPLYACACGCGIFEVGTASMLPHSDTNGMLYFEYDYQDQYINWSGVKPAPGSANDDKNIRTNFMTLGLQYFFTHDWGVQVELPYDNRSFQTTSAAPGSPLTTQQWGALGDVRLLGIYTGLSEDRSIGLQLGAKIPTGNYSHNNRYGDVDRDSEISPGCWDILGGAYVHRQLFGDFNGFGQISLDAPVDEFKGYRPGLEADAALGAYYTGFHLGHVQINPVAQVLISERGHDSGPNAAHPLASGYTRLLLSPGIEFDVHPFSIYADIEVPVWQHYTGDQLTAPFMTKVILTYNF